MVDKSARDGAFSSITQTMVRFRFVLIKLINEDSGCYKFGIYVALTDSEEKNYSGSWVRKKENPMMKLKPINDRVVLKRMDEETKSKGGIIIPDTAKKKPQRGEVVAVGSGKQDRNGRRISLDLKEKDRVFFGKYSGTEINVEGTDYLILKAEDILCVIE
jgi:chaperonin GroES